ncbi:A-factor biosynthesis hotdog protein [Streptomyces sp. BK208]|uniref:ScbA/BarX family gamma-butyrolactone biosynthesis protein n=1 Tax=Streptomyces sp. BK208 TaxID=2512150 RepID=UPI00105D91A5|nr:ScbA/BarX family gamma-butyrolactone biosynthesis protein [Streptomyces sp. BK208]TDT23050.1 A-factor biosynthesis hotdog protein [Streptomyces sp. BK208]
MLVSADRHVAAPTLTTTVAREFVHRAAFAEVFLTGWRATGQDTFTVTAQWPRSHSFYTSEHGVHDPMLMAETVRQTFPLLAHAAYGMPFGYQLSWSHFQLTLNPQAMRIERTPAEIELRVRCSDIRYQRGLPASMSMDIEALRDGATLAVAGTRFGCHSPKIYERLRAGRAGVSEVFAGAPRPTDPAPCAAVGRTRREDVVLSPSGTPRRWQLRLDTDHPVLFDHAVDHAPGMVLLEAVRQAATAASAGFGPGILTALDIVFHRYVEFGSPCWLETHDETLISAGARSRTRISAHQDGTPVFTASGDISPLPAQ